MENPKTLSLEGFESIFHLLSAYYLLLGTFFEKFNYYFGFSDTILEYDKKITTEKLKEYLDILNKSTERVLQESLIKLRSAKMGYRRKICDEAMEKIHRIKKHKPSLEKAIKNANKKSKQIPYHIISGDKIQSDFFLFFKSFYAISGCFCLSILLISGFAREWNMYLNLEFINFIQFSIMAYVLIRIWVNRISDTFLWSKNTWGIVIIIATLYLITSIIPHRYISHLAISNVNRILYFSFTDFQILLSVFLGLFPIFIHSLTLFLLSYSCKGILEVNDILSPLYSLQTGATSSGMQKLQ